MNRIAIMLGAVLAAATSLASAASSPLGLSDPLRSLDGVEVQELVALDVDALAGEDALNEALGQPPRFAVPHQAQVLPTRSGTWDERDGTSVWRYRVQAEAAASFNFGFSRYRLPEGASLFLYSADGSTVAGPYTAAHNAPHGEFWSPIIAGSDVVIELNVPTALRDQVILELASINQGYRGFGTALKGYVQPDLGIETEAKTGECKLDEDGGRSGACNTDVACLSDGDPWQNERRSAGAYSRSGAWACSGSLINNTANDGRMLFISATHCGVTAANAATMVVYWDYEWPTCRRPGAAGGTATNSPDPNQSSSGATFLAATPSPWACPSGPTCSDVTLVEVSDANDPTLEFFWNGWDRSNPAAHPCPGSSDPNGTDGMCASIHHPGVHEKRITFSETNLVTGNISAAQGVHWRVEWDLTPPELPNFPAGGTLPVSVTEGGSSGSPLFNADRRLVGVLSGGLAACGAPNSSQYDLYGKIAHAWEGGGTAATRIRDYLDPLGLNPTVLDGLGGSPFSLSADPSALAVCAATTGSVDIAIQVDQEDPGFTAPVDLSVAGHPAGSTAGFSPTSVTPPGSSILSLGGLASATSGSYVVTVTGASGTDASTTNIALSLSSAALGATTLVAPADGDPAQPPQPTLEWTANGDAHDYLVEVASDDQFTNIVFSELVSGTSVEIDPALAINATYYWRVTASNGCGVGAESAVYGFSVAGPDLIFANGFEEPGNPDIVEWTDVNHPLAATLNGTSIMWISGDVIDDDPTGWDINFYMASGALSIWWSFSPSISAGVAAASNTANLSVLGSGVEIGPASTFSRTNGAMTAWRAGASGYIGFRFDCSSLPTAPANGTCYGYLEFQTTGSTGYPATIVGWAYNRAGDPITTP